MSTASRPTGRHTEIDIDAVTALVEHVAATVVTPRFRTLLAGDISEKGPGDLVTVVDTEAERVLTLGLGEIAPGTPVVGEEDASARPEILGVLDGAPMSWVVDPLDGTQAFVDGSPDHAVMVALLEHGEAVAGWICLPQHGATFVAQRGSGAYRNGVRLTRAPTAQEPGDLRGGVAAWYLEAEVRARIEQNLQRLGPQAVTSARLWSGFSYAQVADGAQDFLVYSRTSPWDHAPGAVLLRETGGVSRRFDGRDYRPGESGRGLLAAADTPSYDRVRSVLGLDR
ncbi:inositol monophosphatase [Actinotalea sp. K2]|uniref:inositol monophosphatase family protein n=1 Tax=Actinotalea sp. K2 TaxID=2939438 RepID=UPI0020170824|nr:inositol monophosphatase [Actinotalea sp. K2]MCL3859969.1 inositol monophosphatase [Actinotalea sp. K2]